MSAVNVGNLSPIGMFFLVIREFTLEKSLIHAVIVENYLGGGLVF